VPGTPKYRFGAFELDARARELRRRDRRVKIQAQPFELLLLLLERPAEVVTREEIRRKLWPGDTFVDFEYGVNSAVKKLRRALSDSTDDPRFIETLPRVGYRFLAPVERVAPPKQRAMLVVLPFENLSNDPEQEYFSDGLTEETITALGQMASSGASQRQQGAPSGLDGVRSPVAKGDPSPALTLGIIARTSAMAYKRTSKSIAEIGRELEVDYAVEGSVRRDRNRVRITVQLIRTADQTHLWAQNYDRDLKDFIAVQGELGRAIAEQIRIQLAPPSPARAVPALNPAAYDAYLRGRFHLNRITRPNIERAIQYFQQATELDPGIAVAYAGLADAYVMLPISSDAPSRDVVPNAMLAACRALEIDPELAEAHVAAASANFWYDWDWKQSERSFRRALALNANYSWAHFRYAHLLSNTGRHEEAFAEVAIARELDPLSLIINTMCGQFRYQAGRLDEALPFLARALDLDPNFWVAHVDCAKVYAAQGRYEEALASATRARQSGGGSTEPLSLIGHAAACLGRRDHAQDALRELLSMTEARYVPPYNVALVYLALGDIEKCLEWLERAFADRDVRLVFLRVEPKWNPLRSNPRFRNLVKRVGLPPR
jgi:TolB-like protein/Tfp pilus assembly protein PilF